MGNNPVKKGELPDVPGALESATMRVDAVGEATPEPDLTNADEPRRYTVQPGDTLSTISKHFYGDADQHERILKANGLKQASDVHPGDRIIIPPLEED